MSIKLYCQEVLSHRAFSQHIQGKATAHETFCPLPSPVLLHPCLCVWGKGLVPTGCTQCSTTSLRAQICTILIVWNQFCFVCIEWEMFLFQLFGANFYLSSGNDRPKIGMKWKLRSSFLSYCEEMFLRGEVILIKDYEDTLIKKENSDVHRYIIH